MRPFIDHIAELTRQLEARPSLPLTARELQVGKLVSQGLTNRAIAARLVVSERTAQNHVQHILDKLGLANRSQIARVFTSAEMSRSPE